jgi:hypothetical protein
VRRALVTLALLALPAVAEACAVCGAADRNRNAFLGMTIFLSLLPLGMIGGGVLWLRRRGGALWHAEFEEREEPGASTPPPPPGPPAPPAR